MIFKKLFINSSDFPVTDCYIESKKEDYILDNRRRILVT